MTSRHTLLLLLTLSLLVSMASANEKDAEATALIEHAKQLSDIRAEGEPAFRLKVSFKIIQEDGSALEGVYTEDWVSKAQWRRETVLANFQRTRVAAGRKLWLLDSAATVPEHIDDILSFSEMAKFNPMLWNSNRKVEDREVKGSNARCIESRDPSGPTQALCFDKMNGTIVAEVQPLLVPSLAERVCFYSDYEKFGDRLFARSYGCDVDNHPRLRARVVELVAAPAPDATFFAPLEGAKESVNCLGTVKMPTAIYSPNPTMPRGASRGSTTWVMISMIVGTDGKPYNLRITSAPNHDFDEAALKTVRQWRFKAATCDGDPVEKQMAVETEFHLFK
jgi:TonB family protein